MAEPFTCRQLVELVTGYLDGSLSSDEQLAFERHLAICPPCRGYLTEIRHTISLAGELTEETIPPDVRDDMLRVFRSWNATRSRDP